MYYKWLLYLYLYHALSLFYKVRDILKQQNVIFSTLNDGTSEDKAIL